MSLAVCSCSRRAAIAELYELTRSDRTAWICVLVVDHVRRHGGRVTVDELLAEFTRDGHWRAVDVGRALNAARRWGALRVEVDDDGPLGRLVAFPYLVDRAGEVPVVTAPCHPEAAAA